jgi:phosphoribosyl-ATP pyrophosphohydrolase
MSGDEAEKVLDGRILDRLHATIEGRRSADPENSYSAALLARGPEKIAQKLGEEAVEVVIEAVRGDRDKLAAELADLLYHMTALMAVCGLAPEDVWRALQAREGRSGLKEKAARREGGKPK